MKIWRFGLETGSYSHEIRGIKAFKGERKKKEKLC